MPVERRLHLGRVHAEARRLDEVLLALDDAQVALVVEAADVAGREPAVAQRLRGWPRAASSSPSSPSGPRTTTSPGSPGGSSLVPSSTATSFTSVNGQRQRRPCRTSGRCGGLMCVGRRRLRQAVALDQLEAGDGLPALGHGLRHRRAARAAGAHRAEVVVLRARVARDGDVDRRDQRRGRAAVALDRGQDRLQVEAADARPAARPGRPRG